MKQHYSEADLLETYYTQPGESMPVMMHLADCSACAERYERLNHKLRTMDACADDKAETFWARQRIAVMRRIDARRERPSFLRVAAAAVLAFVLIGLVTWRSVDRRTARPAVQTQTIAVATATAAAMETTTTASEDVTDPWQSDALKDYQPVVAWESWVEKGDQSL